MDKLMNSHGDIGERCVVGREDREGKSCESGGCMVRYCTVLRITVTTASRIWNLTIRYGTIR